ncbi:hypothetical protein [Fusibacter bizertensis]
MGKLSKFNNNQGASEIGIVITCFFMLILVVIPLNLVIQELALLNNINHSVQIASEMVMLDMVEKIDTIALSESKLHYNLEVKNAISGLLQEKLLLATGLTIEPMNLTFELLSDQLPNKIEMKFNYRYTSMVFLKGNLQKNVFVKLDYELPVNR